jgi:hypothetical protein
MAILKLLLTPVQNIGLYDRVIRGSIAALLIVLSFYDLKTGSLVGWHVYVILLSIYPALTSILGWDPLYSLFNVRSCGGSRFNQCGTFPFEMDSALGHNPSVDSDQEFDHSMSSVHQHDALPPPKSIVSYKTLTRILIFATVILTIAVIATMYWGPG